MGKRINICSWNVRGVKDKLKKQIIFSIAKKGNVKILCLQETHLVKDTCETLSNKQFRTQFHSTHSSYSRGVSVLISTELAFSCGQSRVDEKGRYIFLSCLIENRRYILANVYIPPPFCTEVMEDLARFVADFPGTPVIALGDFNMTMNGSIDRFPPKPGVGEANRSPLLQYCDELGLVDIWRRRHPGERQYSCHSRTHATLSRIDLVLGNEEALNVVEEIVYEPRGISDHTPVIASVRVGGQYGRGSWKINPFWLELIGEEEKMMEGLSEYISINLGSASLGVVWDSLKAHIRGALIQRIAHVKKQSQAVEMEAKENARLSEAHFVATPSQVNHECWVRRQEEYSRVLREKAEKIGSFQRRSFFGEGEKIGKALSLIIKANGPPSAVPAIIGREGEIRKNTPDIVNEFKMYFEKLYSSTRVNVEGEMQSFFEGLEITPISEVDREMLDAPLTLKELQSAVGDMAAQKSPGPDGLPIELYKKYGEVLLPLLLKVFNGAKEEGALPPSMAEAIVILLLKEGKNPIDMSSYRPISLLCSDVKILAKVMAARLNKIIPKLIHPDQSGFIPNRSTSTNIRRVYLNMQIPIENSGRRAILSLDAAKAFDSLEWHYLWKVLAEYQLGPGFARWLRLLYSEPRAKVKINGQCSEGFQLSRGTRQGCPLSPLLFALAIEPLAVALRMAQGIQGFKRKRGVDKVALYADDILLFLADTQESLETAMRIVREFGNFSGLLINWEKSVILPIDTLCEPLPHQASQVQVVRHMKYLGINITRDPSQYISGNLVPLMKKLKQKCQVWRRLPLSVAGRCNLIKMVWLPQILYVMQNSPVWIPKHWFKKLDSIFRELIWKEGVARIGLETLRRPEEKGGLAVPDPRGYFLAAQLQQMGGSNRPGEAGAGGSILLNDTRHDTVAEGLEAD